LSAAHAGAEGDCDERCGAGVPEGAHAAIATIARIIDAPLTKLFRGINDSMFWYAFSGGKYYTCQPRNIVPQSMKFSLGKHELWGCKGVIHMCA
jgi:hypothetical protein